MYVSKKQLERYSQSYETDEEILRAICAISENWEDVERIWEDPSDEELLQILESVKKSDKDITSMLWGENTLPDILNAAFPDHDFFNE